jgi:hypothetical protein
MTDLTSTFNELLKERETPPTRPSYDINDINEFLKEAYRIVCNRSVCPYRTAVP